MKKLKRFADHNVNEGYHNKSFSERTPMNFEPFRFKGYEHNKNFTFYLYGLFNSNSTELGMDVPFDYDNDWYIYGKIKSDLSEMNERTMQLINQLENEIEKMANKFKENVISNLNDDLCLKIRHSQHKQWCVLESITVGSVHVGSSEENSLRYKTLNKLFDSLVRVETDAVIPIARMYGGRLLGIDPDKDSFEINSIDDVKRAKYIGMFFKKQDLQAETKMVSEILDVLREMKSDRESGSDLEIK